MNPRDYLLAELDRRIRLCREAPSGPWMVERHEGGEYDDSGPWVFTEDGTMIGDVLGTAADLIAAHDPTSLAAIYEWMRGEVGRHARLLWARQMVKGYLCAACGYGNGFFDDGGACPFVAGLASALGYPGGGAQGTPTEGKTDDAAADLGDADREVGATSVRDGADSHDVGDAAAEVKSADEKGERGLRPAALPPDDEARWGPVCTECRIPLETGEYRVGCVPCDKRLALARAASREAPSAHAEGGAVDIAPARITTSCGHDMGPWVCGLPLRAHEGPEATVGHEFVPGPPAAPVQSGGAP